MVGPQMILAGKAKTAASVLSRAAKPRPALQQETPMEAAMLWRSALLKSNEATLWTPTRTDMRKLVNTKADTADSATLGFFLGMGACMARAMQKVLQRHGSMEFYLRPLNLPITSIYFTLFFFLGISSSLPNLCVKTSTSDVCLIQSVRPLNLLQQPTKGASWATAD